MEKFQNHRYQMVVLCLEAWLINSHHTPLNRDDSSFCLRTSSLQITWVYERSCVTSALDNPTQKWTKQNKIPHFCRVRTAIKQQDNLDSRKKDSRKSMFNISQACWIHNYQYIYENAMHLIRIYCSMNNALKHKDFVGLLKTVRLLLC